MACIGLLWTHRYRNPVTGFLRFSMRGFNGATDKNDSVSMPKD
jgi:hypothetical protein